MRILVLIISFLAGSFAYAEYPADIASKQLTSASSIDDILDALDARGHGLKSFSADVKLDETTLDIADTTTKTGKVSYEDLGDGKARIHVRFDTVRKNEAAERKQRLDYALIDGNLIERNYQTHSQNTQQVLRPGQKIDLFKLGEGPFPLPIGQPKEEVLKQFDVKKIDAGKDDPAGAVHLRLTPNASTKLARKIKTIDAWADGKTHMPVRIDTRDKNETLDRRTELSNIQINPKLADSDFDLGKLPDANWNVTEQAFQD